MLVPNTTEELRAAKTSRASTLAPPYGASMAQVPVHRLASREAGGRALSMRKRACMVETVMVSPPYLPPAALSASVLYWL